MSDAIAISGTRRAIKELVDGTIRVQIDVDPQFRKAFFELFPDIDMAVALAPLQTITPSQVSREALAHFISASEAGEGGGGTGTGTGQAPDQSRAPGPPNELARVLHAGGYFLDPRLWAAVEEAKLYSQYRHKGWIEGMACCFKDITGRVEGHKGDVCAHHTPSAALPASGRGPTPHKVPDWYTVPLCHHHHRNWAHGSATREEKQLLVEWARKQAAGQMKACMKQFLGLESLHDLTAEEWRRWSETIGYTWRPGDELAAAMEGKY